MLEHGRLWLVAQRGYAAVPDGLKVDRGIMGRAVRLARAQLAVDVHSDPDYVSALPGVRSELAVPIRVGRVVVGALNIESERVLPAGAARLLRPLAAALAPRAEALRATRLDLAALARLWDDVGKPAEVARWRSESSDLETLSVAELAAARTLVDSRVVCQLLEGVRLRGRSWRDRSLVWLPLRAEEQRSARSLRCTVRATAPIRPSSTRQPFSPRMWPRRSTPRSLFSASAGARSPDSLTGILNRRGLENRLDSEIALAQDRGVPVSLLAIDCDDFKEINDRAGHEFGDDPFDGAAPSSLLRAADQALYAAKSAGKNRIASFRDIAHPDPTLYDGIEAGAKTLPRGRTGGSSLADVLASAAAIEAEDTVDGVCSRLCKTLVFVVGATACSASKVDGDYLVDATKHALREVWFGDEAAYRLSDFPLTVETLRAGRPRELSFLDAEVDPAEACILRELSMNALLMLPLRVAGRTWGLVELYERRLRRFTADDIGTAARDAGGAATRGRRIGGWLTPAPSRLRAPA